MSIEDDYIEKALKAIRSGDSAKIDATAREIVGAFSSAIPHLANYRGSRLVGSGSDRHTQSDLRKLVGKLKVLREDRDRELYGPYGLETICEHINFLEDVLTSGIEGEELSKAYARIDSIYFEEYDSYSCGLSCEAYSPYEPCYDQTILRIEKLKCIRDKEMRQLRVAENQKTYVNMRQETTNSNSLESSVTVDIATTVSQIDSLPESSLGDNDKTLLKGMVADLAEKDGKKRETKLKKLLGWLSTKGTDVFIVVMPYILKIIESQMGK